MTASRPTSARPRSDASAEHGQLSPSDEELAAIEAQRIDWARLQGATVEAAPELGGRLVTHSASGSSLNYLAGIRWDEGNVDSTSRGCDRADE